MPRARARGRGSRPVALIASQTGANSSRSRIMRDAVTVSPRKRDCPANARRRRPGGCADPVLRLLFLLGPLSPLGENAQERISVVGYGGGPGQRALKTNHVAVEVTRTVFVLG